MAKTWTDDTALVKSLAENLCEASVLLPRQLMHMDDLSRSFHMPFSHIQILIMLANGDKSIGMISYMLGIAKPNITPLLDALMDRNLVQRIRSTEDRRIVYVHLTDDGRKMLDDIYAAVMEEVCKWDEFYGRPEAKHVNAAMESMVNLVYRRAEANGKE